MSILKELVALTEAAKSPKVYVVAKLSMQGIDSDTMDDIDLTVTVFTKCKSADEAEELRAKMQQKSDDDEEIGEDPDDALVHYANNSVGGNKSVHAVSGGAYIEWVKTAAEQPKLTRKVFGFNPEDLGL